MISKGDSDLKERLLNYSVAIIDLVDGLPTTDPPTMSQGNCCDRVRLKVER